MSFTVSTRFREAAVAINELPVEKLPLLLNRIIEKLHLRGEKLFTNAEEKKLQTLFDLNEATLSLILNSCCYIFEQAAFSGTGPEPLMDVLLGADFDEIHAKCIARFWAKEAAEFVGKLKQKTLGAPALVSTDYHLNILTSDSNLSKLCQPTALLELTINNNNGNTTSNMSNAKVTSGENTKTSDKLCLEFSHEELYAFFNQLERIQSQIDHLSK